MYFQLRGYDLERFLHYFDLLNVHLLSATTHSANLTKKFQNTNPLFIGIWDRCKVQVLYILAPLHLS